MMHLYAFSDDLLENSNPDLTFEITYGASVRPAKIAKKAGIRRHIFSSSCSVYGGCTLFGELL
jgi:nucleoside-diphosphate-sugar epimerase